MSLSIASLNDVTSPSGIGPTGRSNFQVGMKKPAFVALTSLYGDSDIVVEVNPQEDLSDQIEHEFEGRANIGVFPTKNDAEAAISENRYGTKNGEGNGAIGIELRQIDTDFTKIVYVNPLGDINFQLSDCTEGFQITGNKYKYNQEQNGFILDRS